MTKFISRTILLLATLSIMGCKNETANHCTAPIAFNTEEETKELNNPVDAVSKEPSAAQSDSLPEPVVEKDKKTSVLVVQCSNGYTYALKGFDFNPSIFTALKAYSQLDVLPFPYKKLMNVSYQGVYDKKYAKAIIKKVDVDVLVMTRFVSNAFDGVPTEEPVYWGYETKVLNTKTMKKKVSMGKSKLMK